MVPEAREERMATRLTDWLILERSFTQSLWPAYMQLLA